MVINHWLVNISGRFMKVAYRIFKYYSSNLNMVFLSVLKEPSILVYRMHVNVPSSGTLPQRGLTVSVLVGFPIARRIVLYDCPVHAVAQLLVHVDSNLVRHSYKEINKKSTLSVIKKKKKKQKRMGEVLENNTGMNSSSLHLQRPSLLSLDKAV